MSLLWQGCFIKLQNGALTTQPNGWHKEVFKEILVLIFGDHWYTVPKSGKRERIIKPS